MSSEQYPGNQIAQDAVAFAKSRFGQHYLARLRSLHEAALANAMNDQLTDSFRLNQATRAGVLRDEIEYFRLAERIQSDPKLLTRIKDNLAKRLSKEADDKQPQ